MSDQLAHARHQTCEGPGYEYPPWPKLDPDWTMKQWAVEVARAVYDPEDSSRRWADWTVQIETADGRRLIAIYTFGELLGI